VQGVPHSADGERFPHPPPDVIQHAGLLPRFAGERAVPASMPRVEQRVPHAAKMAADPGAGMRAHDFAGDGGDVTVTLFAFRAGKGGFGEGAPGVAARGFPDDFAVERFPGGRPRLGGHGLHFRQRGDGAHPRQVFLIGGGEQPAVEEDAIAEEPRQQGHSQGEAEAGDGGEFPTPHAGKQEHAACGHGEELQVGLDEKRQAPEDAAESASARRGAPQCRERGAHRRCHGRQQQRLGEEHAGVALGRAVEGVERSCQQSHPRPAEHFARAEDQRRRQHLQEQVEQHRARRFHAEETIRPGEKEGVERRAQRGRAEGGLPAQRQAVAGEEIARQQVVAFRIHRSDGIGREVRHPGGADGERQQKHPDGGLQAAG